MATIASMNILLNLKDNVTGALDKPRAGLVSFGKSLQNVGAGLTAGLTAPILGMAAVSVKAASDLQESMSAVEQVYGSAADTVTQRSLEAAAAVGLSQQEYLATAAVLGVYGDTLGLSESATADFSNSLIGAAADLGSFYNANTPDVLSAMQAALRGEFDPLERFGIMMNQAALEQYALENGISDGSSALTAQQRILAAQGFILDHMGDATGDFARTSGGLANTQKILSAQLKNVAAQLGQVLLPAITKMAKMFGDLLTRFQSLSPEWQKWIVMIGLVVAGIGPLLIVLGTILTLLPAIGAALAVLTGPIGLVIAAIALLTAAYIGNWWGFRDAVDGIALSAGKLVDKLWGIDAVRTTVTSAFDAIVGSIERVTSAFGKIGTAILDGDWRTALAGIGDALSAPYKAIGDFIKGIETGFAPLDKLLTNVGNMFTDFGRIIQELFQGDFSGAFDVFERAIQRVPEIVKGAFAMIPWSAIGSALVTAIQALPERIPEITGPILSKLGEWGGKIGNWIRDAIPGGDQIIGFFSSKVPDVAGTVIEKLGDLAGKIKGWITDAIPSDWSTFFSDISIPEIPGLGTLQSVLDDVSTAAEAIGTAIGTAATTIAGVSITLPGNLEFLRDLLVTVKSNAELVGETVIDAGKAIAGVVFAIPSGLTDLAGLLTSAVDKAREWIGLIPFIGDSGDAPSIPGPGDPGFIGPIAIEAPKVEMPDFIIPTINLETFNLALAAIPTNIADTFVKANTEAASGVNGIATVVGDTLGTMLQNTTGMMNGFTAIIGQGMSDALGVAATYSEGIVTAVGAILGGLQDVGRNAAIGLASGMLSAIASVQAAALELALTARRTVEAALKVSSPSRVFMEIGGHLGDGLAIGMERSLPGVRSAAGAMAAASKLSGADRGENGYGSGGYGGNRTYQNNYGTIIQEAPRHPSEALDNYSIARSRG